MSDSITIFGKEIPLSEDDIHINKLKFLQDNPRVFSCTLGEPDFESLTDEQKQERIYAKLLEEQSVIKLIPDIRKHEGLMEPILVRCDKWEVVEGNSRLAVYRKLYKQTQDEKWEYIKCRLVSKLTEEQQATYLSQIHVKGKTPWSAYEKANLAYNLSQKYSLNKVVKMSGESTREINQRIKVIEMMKENEDADRSHFSYYNDVMVRNRDISNATAKNPQLKEFLLEKIKETKVVKENKIADSEDLPPALDLRNKLPVIVKNSKVLKKWINGAYDFDDAYDRAGVSDIYKKINKALSYLENIEKKDLEGLDPKAHYRINRLVKVVDRIKNIADEIKNS